MISRVCSAELCQVLNPDFWLSAIFSAVEPLVCARGPKLSKTSHLDAGLDTEHMIHRRSCWSAELLHLAGQELRLKGKNLTESDHVAPGAYHTLQIETQRAFTLEKALWDAVDLDRIQVACNPAARADLAAILMTVRSCL